MDYTLLPPGNNVPEEVNAIVEIAKGEGRLKREYRREGYFIIDRLRGKNQPPYPVHYCGIPKTLAPDGDPLDVLILCDEPFEARDVVPVRPIAVFWMKDDKGDDPKIIAVPADRMTDEYLGIRALADIPPEKRKEIETFFADYKKGDLAGKWSQTGGWEDVDAAHKIIRECVERHDKAVRAPAPPAAPPKP
jgi:inorganic pyrophosphatase